MAGNNTDKYFEKNEDYVMDLAAEKIVVLDLDDVEPNDLKRQGKEFDQSPKDNSKRLSRVSGLDLDLKLRQKKYYSPYYGSLIGDGVCLSYHAISFLTFLVTFSILTAILAIGFLFWRRLNFDKKL